MKYFVTGGTGFIGGHIVRQLCDAGHGVVALVRSPEKGDELGRLGAAVHHGDITDRESMRGALDGVDGVFHTAGWYKLGARDKTAGLRINVHGTRNVLELMREANVRKGVYTSTLAVFSDTKGKVVDESYYFRGKHLTEYDRTKWLTHYEVALPMIRDGLPLVIVQPGLVYGPGDLSPVHEMLVQYLRGKLPLIPRQTAYCWSHVDDVARAHLLAMEKGQPGESYIIGGDLHTLVEALEVAEQITGFKLPRRRVGPRVLRCLAAITRWIGAIVPLPNSYHYERLRAAAGVTYLGDSSKAKHELGYSPRPLHEGLRETLSYEMDELGIQPKGKAD